MKLKFLTILIAQSIFNVIFCSDTGILNSQTNDKIKKGQIKTQFGHSLHFYTFGHDLPEVTETKDGRTQCDELKEKSAFKPLIDDIKKQINYESPISPIDIEKLDIVNRLGRALCDTLFKIIQVNSIAIDDLKRWGLGCLGAHNSDKFMAQGTYRSGDAKLILNQTDLTDPEECIKKARKIIDDFVDLKTRTKIVSQKLWNSVEKSKNILFNKEINEFDDTIYSVNQYQLILNNALFFIKNGEKNIIDGVLTQTKLSPYNQHVMLNNVLNYILGVENAYNQYILQTTKNREFIDYESIEQDRRNKTNKRITTAERVTEVLTGGKEKQLKELINNFFNIIG